MHSGSDDDIESHLSSMNSMNELKRRGDNGDNLLASNSLHSIVMSANNYKGSCNASNSSEEAAAAMRQTDEWMQLCLTVVGLPLLIIAFVASIVILAHGQDVFQPLFIAIFFSYLIRPIINCLTTPFGDCLRFACCVSLCQFLCKRVRVSRKNAERDEDDILEMSDIGLLSSKRVAPAASDARQNQRGCAGSSCPHWLAVVVAFVFVLGIIGASTAIIINAVSTFEQESLTVYEQQAAIMQANFREWLHENFKLDSGDMLEKLGNDIGLSSVFSMALSFIYNTISSLFVVFLFILYLLFEKSPDNYSKESLRSKIDHQIQRYILLKTLISTAVAVAAFIILGPILKVRLSSLWGVLTFVLNFIPNVGPIIATLLPIPVVIFDPDLNSAQMVLAITLPGLVHAVVGNAVEPTVFGDHLDLHPIFLLLSLSFWFTIWGVSGAILCVPIMAVLRIIISHSRHPYATGMLHLMEGNLYPLLATSNPNTYERDR